MDDSRGNERVRTEGENDGGLDAPLSDSERHDHLLHLLLDEEQSPRKPKKQPPISFYKDVFKPAVSWFLDTHAMTSTYSIYPMLSELGFLERTKALFRMAFPFDGLDTADGMVTAADGTRSRLNKAPMILWILSFLGLPSRAESITKSKDYSESGIVKFSVFQFFANFIGGWTRVKESLEGEVVEVGDNFDERTQSYAQKTGQQKTSTQKRWTEKKIILGLLFTFKFLIVLPFKLVVFPFKFAWNIVKLVTEVLLPFVSMVLAIISATLFKGVMKSWSEIVESRSKYNSKTRGLEYTYHFHPEKLGYIFPVIFIGAFALAFGAVQYAALWACRIALAMTSPEQSFRRAFAAGRKFRIGAKDSKFQIGVSYVMGGLGAIISLVLTGFSWMFVLPVAVSGLATAFPSILSAIQALVQLPVVATVLTWFTQLPLVSSSIAIFNSLIAAVGPALVFAFGPALTFMAGLVTVQVPAATMYLTMTLGLFFVPAISILSHGMDKLANLWTAWVEQAPFAGIKAFYKSLVNRRSKEKPLKDDLFDEDWRNNLLAGAADYYDFQAGYKNPKDYPLYVYQPQPGEEYIISPRPLYLVMDKEEAVSEANNYLEGVVVTGKKAVELLARADNVETKGLLTQGVRKATTTEFNALKSDPAEPEGIYKKPSAFKFGFGRSQEKGDRMRHEVLHDGSHGNQRRPVY